VNDVDGVSNDSEATPPAWLAVTPTDGASVEFALGPNELGPSVASATRRFGCNEPLSERALDLRDLGRTAKLIGDVLSAAGE
jgi:hypothetical protein